MNMSKNNTKSKSYKKATCCNCDCDLLGVNSNEQCWGQVNTEDEVYDAENYYYLHSCEGYAGYYSEANWGYKYKQE